jgi:transposase
MSNQQIRWPVDKEVPRFECYNYRNNILLGKFHSVEEAAKFFKVSKVRVYNNLSGKNKKCLTPECDVYFKYIPSDAKPLTKKDKVRNWLNEGKSITGLEALKLFGLYRLSDAIFKLRKEGMLIKSEDVTIKGATFAMYSKVV